MLTSRERAKLRSLSQTVEVITQIGKSGITEEFLEGLDKAIEKRELIKVNVLDNSGLDVKEAGIIIAEKLNAEFVCATGRKLVFYRKSSNEKNVKIIL